LADFASPEAGSVAAGQISPATGAMSFAYVDAAIAECVAGRADAVVTAPIHKQAWQAAGIAFPGHTELLADRTGATRQCMMLTAEEISCSLVTVHVALNEVPLLLETERVFEVIVLTARAMTARGIDRPSVSVLGLNPHAGEGGLFGREEVEIIAPAVERARAAGLDVVGPLPPDTAFTPAWRAKTDAYVCMYHDQGLIPLKALAFDTAVNVTLGLPIVRTSVDHGTALDIAWRGEASAESLCEAVKLAALMAAARRP
ncbi:MAG: 4-hydroxythreonine-4-phosphate dehydrogenase PdxA, partial [Planctomycetota bacterium]